MEPLMKIQEVSKRYDVTARTLRYYENAGLLHSIRSEDYAFRLYDAQALTRLEQILVLRKLNIPIRDIRRIFQSNSADALIDSLSRKVENIDDEVALLHELRALIQGFLQQIEALDFDNPEDVRRLYAASSQLAKEIALPAYRGNESPGKRALDIAEQLAPLPDVRIVSIPPSQMITSGCDVEMSYAPQTPLGRFDAWLVAMAAKRQDLTPRDFMWYDAACGGLVWGYLFDEDVPAHDGFPLIDFEGGLYATAICRDQDEADHDRVRRGLQTWARESEQFEWDQDRFELGHVITPMGLRDSIGYDQMELYLPIRLLKQPA